MGWTRGNELADNVWQVFKKYVPAQDRKKVATKLVDLFEDMDCDTICEIEELCKLAHDHTKDE